jgi:hypothetical protein
MAFLSDEERLRTTAILIPGGNQVKPPREPFPWPGYTALLGNATETAGITCL